MAKVRDLQDIRTWTDQVTSSSSRDGDIVRFGRREAEKSENEARQKVFLHTRGQGGVGVLEDVYRLVGIE